jgi:biotin operon repressor
VKVSVSVANYLKTADLSAVRLEEVAKRLGMSRTILVQHLEREDTGYRMLLDQERKRRATLIRRSYGDGKRLPAELVTEAIGYRHNAAYQAWMRWFDRPLRLSGVR